MPLLPWPRAGPGVGLTSPIYRPNYLSYSQSIHINSVQIKKKKKKERTKKDRDGDNHWSHPLNLISQIKQKEKM